MWVLQVAIVTLGVAIRSLGAGTAKSTAVADQKIATGIAFTVASAALYSLLGVTYEVQHALE